MKGLGLGKKHLLEWRTKLDELRKEVDELIKQPNPVIREQYGRNNLWFEYEKLEGRMDDKPYYGAVRILKMKDRDMHDLEVIASFDVAFMKEFLEQIGEL